MTKQKTLWKISICAILLGGALFLYQVHRLKVAHATFENYYTFRGCETLIDKTDTYGDCKLASGQVIKIVKYRDKWYLDGDLPWACVTNDLCFGM